MYLKVRIYMSKKCTNEQKNKNTLDFKWPYLQILLFGVSSGLCFPLRQCAFEFSGWTNGRTTALSLSGQEQGMGNSGAEKKTLTEACFRHGLHLYPKMIVTDNKQTLWYATCTIKIESGCILCQPVLHIHYCKRCISVHFSNG